MIWGYPSISKKPQWSPVFQGFLAAKTRSKPSISSTKHTTRRSARAARILHCHGRRPWTSRSFGQSEREKWEKTWMYPWGIMMIWGITNSHIMGITMNIIEYHDLFLYNLDEHWCIHHTSSTAQGGGGSFKNRKPIGELGCCESGMAERSHWWTERCLRSPLFLSLSLFFSLILYLSLIIYLPAYWSICLPIYLSVYLPPYLSIYLSSCLAL